MRCNYSPIRPIYTGGAVFSAIKFITATHCRNSAGCAGYDLHLSLSLVIDSGLTDQTTVPTLLTEHTNTSNEPETEWTMKMKFFLCRKCGNVNYILHH